MGTNTPITASDAMRLIQTTKLLRDECTALPSYKILNWLDCVIVELRSIGKEAAWIEFSQRGEQ